MQKRDVYDLASVMGAIVREQSEKLDFKEVLHIQKAVIYMLDEIKDFSDQFSKLDKEKQIYVKNANEKIGSFKKKLQTESGKTPEDVEKYKEKVEEFVQSVLEEAQTDIEKEITPQYDELYKVMGVEEVELTLDEDKHKMIVINFELFAKEKYTNKSRMVEVYETLISADSK